MHVTKNNVAFIPNDDAFADYLAKDLSSSVVRFGQNCNKNISAVIESGLDGTVFTYGGVRIRFPLIGFHNVTNALAAIAVAEKLGLDALGIKSGLESIKPLFGRGQVIRGDITIIQDCYNANPDSAKIILGFARDVSWSGKKIVVLGDMLELGKQSKELHREVGEFAAFCKLDCAVFFGTESNYALEAYQKAKRLSGQNCECFYSTKIEEVTAAVVRYVQSGDLVLLKASKGMALWRVAESLQTQAIVEKGVLDESSYFC